MEICCTIDRPKLLEINKLITRFFAKVRYQLLSTRTTGNGCVHLDPRHSEYVERIFITFLFSAWFNRTFLHHPFVGRRIFYSSLNETNSLIYSNNSAYGTSKFILISSCIEWMSHTFLLRIISRFFTTVEKGVRWQWVHIRFLIYDDMAHYFYKGHCPIAYDSMFDFRLKTETGNDDHFDHTIVTAKQMDACEFL